MIHIHQNEVHLGIVKTPLTEVLMKLDKEACLKAEMSTDLQMLFISFIKKFGKATTAEMIELSLKDAIDKEGIADVNN